MIKSKKRRRKRRTKKRERKGNKWKLLSEISGKISVYSRVQVRKIKEKQWFRSRKVRMRRSWIVTKMFRERFK